MLSDFTWRLSYFGEIRVKWNCATSSIGFYCINWFSNGIFRRRQSYTSLKVIWLKEKLGPQEIGLHQQDMLIWQANSDNWLPGQLWLYLVSWLRRTPESDQSPMDMVNPLINQLRGYYSVIIAPMFTDLGSVNWNKCAEEWVDCAEE